MKYGECEEVKDENGNSEVSFVFVLKSGTGQTLSITQLGNLYIGKKQINSGMNFIGLPVVKKYCGSEEEKQWRDWAKKQRKECKLKEFNR